MRTSESIKEIATALATAQSEIENASKTSSNPHFKSKYADLAEVLNTARPVLAKHGIAVVQGPSFDSGIASVTTRLCHKSGEWIESVASAPVSKSDPQGVGSATTYLRRYSLAALCGIAQEDDDGNAATRQAPARYPGRDVAENAIANARSKNDLAAIAKAHDGADYYESLRPLLNARAAELAKVAA